MKSLIKTEKFPFASFIILILLIFTAIFAPIIIPYPNDIINGEFKLENKLQPPNMEHLFGTDELGRDLFSQVIYGVRIAFQNGLFSLGLSIGMGIFFVIAALYFGKRVAETIMYICELFKRFPALSFLLPISIATLLDPSNKTTIIAISAAWWPWYTIMIKKKVDILNEQRIAKVTHSLDFSLWKVIFKQISSSTVTYIIAKVIIDMGTMILMIAALGFIGLGAQPPELEWGLLLHIGREYLLSSWWYFTFPGLFILITVSALSFFGKGLKEYAKIKIE